METSPIQPTQPRQEETPDAVVELLKWKIMVQEDRKDLLFYIYQHVDPLCRMFYDYDSFNQFPQLFLVSTVKRVNVCTFNLWRRWWKMVCHDIHEYQAQGAPDSSVAKSQANKKIDFILERLQTWFFPAMRNLCAVLQRNVSLVHEIEEALVLITINYK